jgi:hypothetical protein
MRDLAGLILHLFDVEGFEGQVLDGATRLLIR